MPATYDSIASTTLGSAQGTVTISSIPNTYTDLILSCQLIPTAGCSAYFQVNGSSSAIYSSTWLIGYGVSASSSRDSNQTRAYIGDITGVSTALINLQNYANTTTNKTIITRTSSAGNGVSANVGLFRDTAAISSITLIANSTTWAAGSTFTLYGIKAA